MSHQEEHGLDDLLAAHLAAELDALTGRSAQRFQQLLDARPFRPMPWLLAGSLTAMAASIALLWALQARWHTDSPAPPSPVTVNQDTTGDELLELERTLAWRTVDEGTFELDDKTPVRKLRTQTLQQVQWYDPRRQVLVEMTVPQEQVLLVGMNTY